MKRNIFTLAFSFLTFTGAYAQLKSYNALAIPEKLKEGAHVVKRFEEINFAVKDVDKAICTIHKVYTVLDEQGASALFFFENTNRLVRIDEVDIRTYDAAGLQTARYKKKDLNKQANTDGLVDDGMYYYMRLVTARYPVTVEYKYEINYSGTARYPAYIIQDPEEAVEYSTFRATVPADLDLRFKEQKIAVEPKVTNEGTNKVYQWEIRNLIASKGEEGSVGYQFYFPGVILAPNKFRHFNTYGDMSTWKALGTWGYELQEGLDVLPQERKDFFTALVKNVRTDREKAALVYDYLQKNFRYVSIQLGIGGVKPFPAKFTDEKKYGDCKGLSFYMYSALKSIGIKSYVAWVNAQYNQEPVDPSFPCDRFNHMILCIPQPKDSIWLECTSNETEFGMLTSFTENRNALLLTENGGVLVSTPASEAANNIFSSTTNIQLQDDGSGNITSAIHSKGDFKELLNAILNSNKDDQKKMMIRSLGFMQPDEFSIAKTSGTELLNLNIDLSIEKIPQFTSGNKMFLSPRVYGLWLKELPKAEERKQDYYFRSPFIRTDTTVYQLPTGFSPEAVPRTTQLKNDYATYTTGYIYSKDKNQFTSVARLELKKNRIPAAAYAEVKKFFDDVSVDCTQKLVIRKN